jgi:hypothetical protein
LAERDVALYRAEAANREVTLRITALAETASAKEDAAAMEIQALKTSHAAMEGALRVARLDRADLQRDVERLRARLAEFVSTAQAGAKGDPAPRQPAARLGREVVRSPAEPEEEARVAAQIMNFARREQTASANYPAESSTGAALRQDQPVASER